MATNLLRRIGLCIIVFAIQGLYKPLNHGLQDGVIFNTRWDAYLPLWPVWIVPYLLCQPLWVMGYGWAALRMDDKLFRSLILASVITTVTGISTYVLFPTYVVRPALVGNDWATEWLRMLYATDGVFNAFPSGHVYLTTIMALFWSRWYPRGRWVLMGFALVVAISTLVIGQHYIPDVIGGAGLAWASYRVGVWFVGLERVGARPDAGWRLFSG